MIKCAPYVILTALLISAAVFAQTTNDPFPTPIPTTDRVITVKFAEFATIPDAGTAAPRLDNRNMYYV